tara:strand:- start:382 stop:588 length:207 start_codon:yes stop_codon:yes gene_type:complete
MPEFIYDERVPYLENFGRWHLMSSLEKELFNEPPYTRERAKEIFGNMFSHSIKINADGVLEDVLVYTQ